MSQLSQDEIDAIVQAVADGRFPTPYEEFRKMAEASIRRAKAGSDKDAAFLLVMLVSMLRLRGASPLFDQVVLLPTWIADYFADALDQGSKINDLTKSLNLKKRRGRNRFTNEQRDMEIDAFAESTKLTDPENYLEKTADLLEMLAFPPPTPGSVWTAEAVADARKAHNLRIKSGLLFPYKS